jgi:hypothetical protein
MEPGLTEDGVLALSDDELVDRLYDRVGDVGDELDDAAVADDLYWLVSEVLERHAPELELRNLRSRLKYDDPRELEAAVRSFRRRQGARMIRDALDA